MVAETQHVNSELSISAGFGSRQTKELGVIKSRLQHAEQLLSMNEKDKADVLSRYRLLLKENERFKLSSTELDNERLAAQSHIKHLMDKLNQLDVHARSN